MSEAIQTFNSIDSAGIEILRAAGYRVDSEVDHPVAILLRSHELLASEVTDSVQVIGRAGSGTNNIDIANATERGIVVMNAAGANSNSVAELVIPGAVAVARNMYDAAAYVQDMQDTADSVTIEREKKRFGGTELCGKTLAVIGLGPIGMRVAGYGLGFGMRVKAHDKYLTADQKKQLDARVKLEDSVTAACSGAYVVSPHVPYTTETKGIIGDSEFAIMDQKGIVLNFARDGVVDEKALLPYLGRSGIRYLTDFPNPLVHGVEGVTEMPHIGASTGEAESNSAAMVATQIDDFISNGNISNSVNFGNINMPVVRGLTRVLVLHRNNPGVAGHIGDVFGSRMINIETSATVAGKKGSGGATGLYSLESNSVNDLQDALDEIEHMEDVLRVREIPKRD